MAVERKLEETYPNRRDYYLSAALKEIEAAQEEGRHTLAWRRINELLGKKKVTSLQLPGDSTSDMKKAAATLFADLLNVDSTSPATSHPQHSNDRQDDSQDVPLPPPPGLIPVPPASLCTESISTREVTQAA